MPEQFMVGFSSLRRGSEESYIAKLIQNALLDEFVFVTTQSSILSRMKKVFRRFEEFDAIPLLNLEKRAPKKWKKAVRGIKKAASIINWIGSIGAYTIVLGPMIGSLVGPTVKGIRLLLVDPAPNGLTLFQ